MKVLNLLTSGGLGGIEILNYDFGRYSSVTQGFAFLFGTGATYERMKQANYAVYDLSKFDNKIAKGRFAELVQIAKEYDIIAVHHGDPYLKLYFIYLVSYCKKKGVTFIHSCWDDTLFFPNSKTKYFIGKKLFQKAMDISKYVIFVSEAGRNSYVNNYKLKNNTKVVYNGIGLDKLEDGSKHSSSNSIPIELLYVGRIEKIKGLGLLIDALNDLKNEYDFHLRIIGEGSQRSALEKKVSNLSMIDKIEFLGGKTDIKPYLRNAEVFVYPSVCKEVFGISIVEAMAYGLICVANNVGGIPEVLQDGYNGYLNKTNDVEGLKEAIRRAIAENYSNEESFIKYRAKETALKFSITNTCNQLDELYKGLIC